MQDKNYNGWTNYATWRVNLEMFDGLNPHEYGSFSDAVAGEGDAAQLASLLKDYAQDYIFDSTEDGLVQHFALAFIADVDWHEIAENMVADYCEA
jgi:hypothetical protein